MESSFWSVKFHKCEKYKTFTVILKLGADVLNKEADIMVSFSNSGSINLNLFITI